VAGPPEATARGPQAWRATRRLAIVVVVCRDHISRSMAPGERTRPKCSRAHLIHRPFDRYAQGTDTPKKIGWEGAARSRRKGREAAQARAAGRSNRWPRPDLGCAAGLNVDIRFAIERPRTVALGHLPAAPTQQG
jgi:hypothetical protein